jgi:hypothetical protein
MAIRTYKYLDTITKKINPELEETNSFHTIDTFVLCKYKTYICLDWTNRSFFGTITVAKFYDSANNIIAKHFRRKVPAFMNDGWVRTYNKSINYTNNKIIKKDFMIVQFHGRGAQEKHVKTVTFDNNGKKTITRFNN